MNMLFKALLKIVAGLWVMGTTAVVIAVGHGLYEQSKYVPPPTIEQHMKNVVAVVSDDGFCSGWVLKGSHQVITAAHCAPADDTSVINVNFGDGKMHPFHIQHKGDAAQQKAPDLMTLTTNDTTVPWPAGEAVCSFKPYYGEALTMFGGPLGFNWTATAGRVGNPTPDWTVPMIMGADPDPYMKSMILYQGDLAMGNSGGMVTDDDTGCVMGVAEIALREQGFQINFLTPASQLAEVNK